MEIYVQSCGLAPEHDYRWLKITKDNQSEDIPPLLKEQINTKKGKKVYLSDLYESHDHSIVLAKDDSKLLLLVTALKAIERSKLYGRGVRNSVAFIGEYCEDEPVLRIIAANALKDWESFRHIIDKAVYFDKNEGFLVDIESINKYIENVTNEVGYRKFETPDPSIKIAKNSRDIKKKLAEELEKYLLPDWDGPLVIVTGNVSEKVLRKHFVWRSVSERVQQYDGENWKQIPESDEDIGVSEEVLTQHLVWRSVFERVQQYDIKKKYLNPVNLLLIGFLIILILASIAIPIILKIPPSTKPQPIQPSQTTPQVKLEPLPPLQVTPQLKLQPSPLPQVTPEQESKQSQLHQETLQPQTTTQGNSSSNSSTRDTTKPNATRDMPPKNLRSITASEQELQPTMNIEQEVDSKLQQPTDQTLQSELVDSPNNSSNSNGESDKADI
ncbi:hypothetical protein [Iningainema tapete]|uniref:Uncharacterized protein n=1 Tax=Iningainema tapete BLCC-T55 TaxID=2748662 RepID=A0A8J6XVX6_9CYAN|nr:hypothetical protein [Iningainema tapete]MBD2778881.1 hypothetical protein [Iningainema tapete BLCC-T55]